MRRAVALGLVAAGLLTAGDVRAGGDGLVAALLRDLTPREGAGIGTLHVVPLVGAPVRPSTSDAWPLSDQTSWRPVEKADGLVELLPDVFPDAPTDDSWAIVPAGTLLLGGARERVLALTEPVRRGTASALPAPICDSRAAPRDPGTRRVGRIAPIDQRKLLLLGETGDAWHTLQQIQAIVGGVPEAETVAEVMASAAIADRVAATERALRRLPEAYAGRTRGHVAFFGFRPVEVVIARTPGDYRIVGPGYLHSLAVSHALWEEALGLVDRTSPEAAASELVPPAERALEILSELEPRAWPRRARQRTDWRNQRGAVVGAGETDRFLVRLVSRGRGDAVLLEAIENGARTIHPLPLGGPAGRPVDEGPDIRGGGLTDAYLRRLMARREQRQR